MKKHIEHVKHRQEVAAQIEKSKDKINKSNILLEERNENLYASIENLEKQKLEIDQRISKTRNQIIENTFEIDQNEKLISSLDKII